jgi:hypothetical protein
VPDYKFGDSSSHLMGLEEPSNKSDPLDDFLGDFSNFEKDLGEFVDSEGEKSKPRVKGRPVTGELSHIETEICDILPYHSSNRVSSQQKESFKRKLNLAISGQRTTPKAIPLGK